MTFDELQNEFAARLYLWATGEVQREVREGFPFLKMLRTGNAYRFLSYIQEFSAIEATQLMMGLLRHKMPEASRMFGERVSEQEIKLVNDFLNSPVSLSGREMDLLLRQRQGEKGLLADRRFLRVAINDALIEVLGNCIFRRTSATWIYTNVINGWIVNTNIDIGGRFTQLSYFHYIANHEVANSGNQANLPDGISVLSWLGIQGGATQWDYLTSEDVTTAVQSLKTFCSHFMAAVPKLLQNLTAGNQ